MAAKRNKDKKKKELISPRGWEELLRMVAAIRFGSVKLVIQDSKVIQIDSTESIRLG